MSNSPAASPRNPGALLQTLHGGMVPMPPPIPPPYMMHQQAVMDLMVPEISRRFEGAPALSKPEFIQQVLNIVQCEPSFFDILYENYKRQVTPSTSSFK
ncbi:hypothetical protein K501DRAFT_186624 [Backusella circina FSU 941]|nr:hypothetical protein K501DRAFT_186624 [Backusella circina FSU 941]